MKHRLCCSDFAGCDSCSRHLLRVTVTATELDVTGWAFSFVFPYSNNKFNG